MGFLDYFRSVRRGSAVQAKERLQIIVAHERGSSRRKNPTYLPALKREIFQVVRKYVEVGPDQIKVHVDRDGDCEVLELNIMLPEEERHVAAR